MAEKTDNNNCSICLNDFTEPKTIECGHEFCVKCLEDYVSKVGKDNRFPCPLCREDVTIPDGGIDTLPSSISGVNTENEPIKSPSPNCEACKKNAKSKFHCLDCKKCLCASCKTPHDSFFSDHRVSELAHSRNTADGSRPFCYRHKTEILEFYCKDCCQIICKECQISDHKGHDTPEINQYGKEALTELTNLKIEFEKKITEQTNYVDDVNKKISALNTSVVTSCAEIDQQVKTICEAVTRKGSEFKLYIQNAHEKEERKMKRIVESSKNFIDELEESVDNINTILKVDSMYDVLDVLPTIKRQQGENEARELIKLYEVSSKVHLGEINTSTLDEMIGRIEITRNKELTHTFKHSEVTRDWRFSPVYKVEDRLWHFKVYQSLRGRPIQCRLTLGMMVYGENLISGKTKVTIKLINNTDVTKTVDYTPQPTTTLFATEFIWNDVCFMRHLSPAGFVNNDQFTVQATLVVTDIKT
ncbi:E3 ubiquitin-protein ligase TRIM71-like [Patella vulgata]|uniref:E3 ubiquitin-protein ligase TRIM71-like n=1 Tax=Patella vulgata TaxID=6465 RepID=UPI00217FB623|nr:E3 ubiquitin-protein ligase TRIM71-like [Patella vulgata]